MNSASNDPAEVQSFVARMSELITRRSTLNSSDASQISVEQHLSSQHVSSDEDVNDEVAEKAASSSEEEEQKAVEEEIEVQNLSPVEVKP